MSSFAKVVHEKYNRYEIDRIGWVGIGSVENLAHTAAQDQWVRHQQVIQLFMAEH